MSNALGIKNRVTPPQPITYLGATSSNLGGNLIRDSADTGTLASNSNCRVAQIADKVLAQHRSRIYIFVPGARRVAIGAVTSGPFTRGGAIAWTNAAGAQTGISIEATANGDAQLLYLPDDPAQLIESGNAVTQTGGKSVTASAGTAADAGGEWGLRHTLPSVPDSCAQGPIAIIQKAGVTIAAAIYRTAAAQTARAWEYNPLTDAFTDVGPSASLFPAASDQIAFGFTARNTLYAVRVGNNNTFTTIFYDPNSASFGVFTDTSINTTNWQRSYLTRYRGRVFRASPGTANDSSTTLVIRELVGTIWSTVMTLPRDTNRGVNALWAPYSAVLFVHNDAMYLLTRTDTSAPAADKWRVHRFSMDAAGVLYWDNNNFVSGQAAALQTLDTALMHTYFRTTNYAANDIFRSLYIDQETNGPAGASLVNLVYATAATGAVPVAFQFVGFNQALAGTLTFNGTSSVATSVDLTSVLAVDDWIQPQGVSHAWRVSAINSTTITLDVTSFTVAPPPIPTGVYTGMKANPMTSPDSGASLDGASCADDIYGEGPYAYTISEYDITPGLTEARPNGMRLNYRPYAGGDSVDIQFYFSYEDADYELCTLVAASSDDGTVNAGTGTIEGVTGDGTNKYVTWNFAADGVSDLARVRIKGRITVAA